MEDAAEEEYVPTLSVVPASVWASFLGVFSGLDLRIVSSRHRIGSTSPQHCPPGDEAIDLSGSRPVLA